MKITLQNPKNVSSEHRATAQIEPDVDGNIHINTLQCRTIVHDCFGGIGFKTDQGMIGVAMRDGGIEVQINGNPVWHSLHGPVR